MSLSVSRLLLTGVWAVALTPPAIASKAESAPSAKPKEAPTDKHSDEKVAPFRSSHRSGPFQIETVDLSPRFVDFYTRADGLAPDARFMVWQQRYDFAALPPTPQAEPLKRVLLDRAWPRYSLVMPRIRMGLTPRLATILPLVARTAKVMQFDEPTSLRVTGYVGGFEDNAFAMTSPEGIVTIALPIEAEDNFYTLTVPHETTHVIHARLAGFSGGYERTLARLIVEEGLAMHVARRISPGLPDRSYTEHRPGWHAETQGHICRIVKSVLPHLSKRDETTMVSFTMGKGAQGFEREAYATGWAIVGNMLKKGWTPRDIASVAEKDLPTLLTREIDDLPGCRKL